MRSEYDAWRDLADTAGLAPRLARLYTYAELQAAAGSARRRRRRRVAVTAAAVLAVLLAVAAL